ncbi:lysoplasmalogenase [Streptomyces griseorubiginosus]|uniref:lysoplasmalogenase n=1 Tax=Streptomyces griseorubiginosus TaxID=67304 RepID=UPI003648574B
MRTPRISESRCRVLLAAFALAAALDLASLTVGFHGGHVIAKPLLMPLLAAWAAARGAPRLLVAALLCGWGGDVLLLSDAGPAFLAGMACFATGHVCYLALFGRHGGPGTSAALLGGPRATALLDPPRTPTDLPGRPRARTALLGRLRARTVLLAPGYLVALVTTVALLWPDLPADLRVPVAGYSTLLVAMACVAAIRLGPVAGLGGVLFLLSDTLIATGVADWPQPSRPDLWIMLTYLAAQFLLATGTLRALEARPGPMATYGEVRSTTP